MHCANELFNIERGSLVSGDNHLSLDFGLNSGNELLAEHFPGSPIVPASLTLGFVCDCVASHITFGTFRLKIRDARFNQPLIPGLIYTCDIEIFPVSRSLQPARFTIRGPDRKVRVRGYFELHAASETHISDELSHPF